MVQTKTDNHDPSAKLALRRYFLEKYHAKEAIHVFDCCQGSGLIWRRLQREFTLTSYWGVDFKPKKGRLKMDSVRVLQQPGLRANVIDVDTYGSPWKHWCALLPRVTQPLTVFLTIGQVSMGTDKIILQSMGLTRLRIPPGVAIKLHGWALAYCLGVAYDHGLQILEALEVESDGNARYLGIRLQPAI